LRTQEEIKASLEEAISKYNNDTFYRGLVIQLYLLVSEGVLTEEELKNAAVLALEVVRNDSKPTKH